MNVYGSRCNYSVFRHAMHATACTSFLTMPHLLVLGSICTLSEEIVLGCSVNWTFRAQLRIDVCLNSVYCLENGVFDNMFIDLVSNSQEP